MIRRRALLALPLPLALALPACGSGGFVGLRQNETARPAQGEGLIALLARRLIRADCPESMVTTLAILRDADRQPQFLHVDGVQVPFAADPPHATQRAACLARLPAGVHAIVNHSYYLTRTNAPEAYVLRQTRLVQALPAWSFVVEPGKVHYLGGILLSPDYAEGQRCAVQGGRLYYLADPAADIAFIRAQRPELAGMEIVDNSRLPLNWRRPPAELLS